MYMTFQQFLYGIVRDNCLHYLIDCSTYYYPQLNKMLHNYVDYQSNLEKAKTIYNTAKGY